MFSAKANSVKKTAARTSQTNVRIDRLLRRVDVEVVLVLLRSVRRFNGRRERLARRSIVALDRRPGEREKIRLRHRCAHPDAELSLLAPVRLVDEHDHVVAVGQRLHRLIEFLNGRDDHAAS